MKPVLVLLALFALVSAQNVPPQPAVDPVYPMDPVATSAASSTSSAPNLAAIFAACASDALTVCEGTPIHACVHNLRMAWATLSDNCKNTLRQELPCIEDAATHCQTSTTPVEVLQCLGGMQASDLSPACVSWLQTVQDEWQGPAGATPQPIAIGQDGSAGAIDGEVSKNHFLCFFAVSNLEG